MEDRDPRNETGRSSLFNMRQNAAGAFIGVLTVAASFVPVVSYFSFVIPLAAALIERKSQFVRACGIQYLILSAAVSVASLVTMLITPYAESAMNAAEMSTTFTLGVVGIVMSVIRIACFVLIMMTAYHAYKMKIFSLPCVTLLAEKIAKYSEHFIMFQ